MHSKTTMTAFALLAATAAAFAPAHAARGGVGRVDALDDKAWESSEWISVSNAPTAFKSPRAADGTSRFERFFVNRAPVVKAVWMTSGLGVYEIDVNGRRVGNDFLKPGFTHVRKTRRSFTYDVTAFLKREAGARNVLGAWVSAGWWRDKIVNFAGRKSAFRAVLALTYADGTTELIGTRAAEWHGAVCGNVTHAAIFDGEEYDARVRKTKFKGAPSGCEVNREFKGVILPSDGAEITLRRDLTLKPVNAYVWQGVTGENKKANVFGKVVVKRGYKKGEAMTIEPGETLIVDFAQNAAAVPSFTFSSEKDAVLTFRCGEMLNDMNGEKSRGNDGPGGSLYVANLRSPAYGMKAVYTFSGAKKEKYMPRYTFFGYRYASITATKKTLIHSIVSIPVTSITKKMETGSITTGDKSVNQFISNVYWGQLSNYLSVPTDCPQRNERLGWSADTQVFAAAALYNATVGDFLRKWMRDMDDSRSADGGYPSVAPYAQYGNEPFRVGWADAGVIVPYTVWLMTGDRRIIDENFDSMKKFVYRQTATEAAEPNGYNYADWLSYDKYETCGNALGGWGKWAKDPDAKKFRHYLHQCYWLSNARMLGEMAAATGRKDAEAQMKATEAVALKSIREKFLEKDGLLLKPMRDMQTASLFALSRGVVEGEAFEKTKAELLKAIAANDGKLRTGFLGTSIILDTLSDAGLTAEAYSLMLNHGCPGWLYSVDQGATTVWERWNSYTKDKGFGPVGMNSFNHYAYGCILSWMYRVMAGIGADPSCPGFKSIVMSPWPDKRVGFVKASYKSPAGLIRSSWSFTPDGDWKWTFTVPAGATARVSLPWAGDRAPFKGEKVFASGNHTLVVKAK